MIAESSIATQICSNLLKKREENKWSYKDTENSFDGFGVVHLASQKFYTKTIETPGNTTWRWYYIVAHAHFWERVENNKDNILKKWEDFWILALKERESGRHDWKIVSFRVLKSMLTLERTYLTGVLDPILMLEKILLRTYCNKLDFWSSSDTKENIFKNLLLQTGGLQSILSLEKILLGTYCNKLGFDPVVTLAKKI